jgi:MFS family permease
MGGIWGRQLGRYPANGPRAFYLGIVILATIILYYELYVGGSVATKISADLHMSLTFLITVSIIGNALGALASIFAGLADRWGRANLVVYGLLITGVLVYAVTFVHAKIPYLLVVAAISLVEGVILVATPALIRDFSPQLGRASAMGFWTLGPVVGSLVVTEVSSHTLDAHPDWQYQFKICGVVGVAVFVIAFFGLRELAPALRDQLMVSRRSLEVELIQLKAGGLDTEAALKGRWPQMLRFDIIGSSAAVAVFLLFYYIAVGLFVVFFVTNYGYTLAQANSLGNWYWSVQVVALIITGLLSDWLKVRKPFMLIGALMSAAGIVLFAMYTTKAAPTFDQAKSHWIGYILLISIGGAIAFAAWMAAFTETVEKHNPAGTATGLAVWGSTLRFIVVIALIGLIYAIPAASTLVDQGPGVQLALSGLDPKLTAAENETVKAVVADPTIVTRAQMLTNQYRAELATAAKLKPTTQAALAANPTDPATQIEALAEISGLPADTVGQVITSTTQYANELATAAAMDPATVQAVMASPTDPAVLTQAVGELVVAFHIAPAEAVARLQALAAVPQAVLQLVATDAPTLQRAAGDLAALSKVPPADLTFLDKYGPGLQDKKVLDQLAYLQVHAPIVQQALKDSPIEWQRWWRICLAGAVVFIPFIWVLTGRWSPGKAHEDARAHEKAVNCELSAMLPIDVRTYNVALVPIFPTSERADFVADAYRQIDHHCQWAILRDLDDDWHVFVHGEYTSASPHKTVAEAVREIRARIAESGRPVKSDFEYVMTMLALTEHGPVIIVGDAAEPDV